MVVDGSDGSLMLGTVVAVGMSFGSLAGMVSCWAGFIEVGGTAGVLCDGVVVCQLGCWQG